MGFSLKSKKKLRTLTIVFLLGVGLVLLAPSSYFSRIQSIEHYEEDASANIRLELWAAGLRMLLENPVLGVGVGNFPTGYGVRYHETKKGGVLWWNPHNVLIHVFSEVGFLGGIWYIMIMMAIVKNNRRIRAFARNSYRDSSYLLAIADGLDLSLLGYVVSGFFITVTYFPHLFFIAGFSSCLSKCHTDNLNKERFSQAKT